MPLAFSSIIVAKVSDFEHAVAQIPDSSLLDAAAVVLRVGAELWLELMAGVPALMDGLRAQASAISQRVQHTRIYLIPDGHSSAMANPSYAARHGPRALFETTPNGPLFQTITEATAADIRQHDLAQIIDAARSRCVICAGSSYHFALPSGAHASQFLRLAEAFVDIATVDRIAYWVAHSLAARVPLLDDGSL